MSAGMARDTHVMVNAITPLGITNVNVHLACMVMAREVALGFASSQLLLQVINVHPLQYVAVAGVPCFSTILYVIY